MSIIKKIEGRRSNGVIITFSEKDIDKVQPLEFIEIVITEIMSYKELNSRKEDK